MSCCCWITCFSKLAFYLTLILFFGGIALKLIIRFVKSKSRKQFSDYEFTIGFFHPFCNSGGGGERVLWSAVKVLQDTYKKSMIIVYTGDYDCTVEKIVENVNKRFTIQMDANRLRFVYLRTRPLVLDKYYPIFTLLGQSIGSMIVGFEAILKFVPSIYFETTGYAFTYPIFNYFGSVPVCCYTHYPTISVDMLNNVAQRHHAFNNRYLISRSKFLTEGKLMYYRFFSMLYSLCGRCATCIMVNSTWTLGHINNLWSVSYRTNIVYPPCDVENFTQIENPKRDDNFFVSSVAQFRPEKNHQLQVRSFARFLEKLDKSKSKENIKLFLVGSCRNSEDEQRVDDLRKLAKELHIENNVEFKLNLSFDDLKQILADSAVGLHSMKEEHFGIGVVECMAAGTVTLANSSGGPKEDIIVPYKGERTGYLAETEEQYQENLTLIYNLNSKQREKVRAAAREHVKKFSQTNFNDSFLYAFQKDCFDKLFKKND